jgi:hypothetical protein
VVPVTVAVNWTDPLGATVTETGETETVMFELGGGLLGFEPLLPPPPQATANAAKRIGIVLARDDLFNKAQPMEKETLFKLLSDQNSA